MKTAKGHDQKEKERKKQDTYNQVNQKSFGESIKLLKKHFKAH